MIARALFLLVTVLWSAAAGATGGVLYTCRMKGTTAMTRCCCPSKAKSTPNAKGLAAEAGAKQNDSASLERLCCEATVVSAALAPSCIEERSRVQAPQMEALAVPTFQQLRGHAPRLWEVVARSTAPPVQERDRYLKIRTLLL